MDRTRKPWPRPWTTRGPQANALRHGLQQLEDRAAPAVIAWDGGPTGNGTDWTDPINWVGDAVPGTTDDVILAATASNPTIVLRSDALVRSVVNDRSLSIVGDGLGANGALMVNAGFANNGLLALTSEGGAFTPSVTLAGGSLTNAAGGTLAGNGIVAGHVTGAGTVSPGTAPDALTLNGNITLGGPFVVELNGTVPCTGYDQLAVNGTVTLNGVRLQASRTFASEPWYEFVILTNDGNEPIVGTFEGLPEGAALTIDGQAFRITYFGGSFHNDVVLTHVPLAKVTSVVVNDFQTNLVQRSRVTAIAVTFDQVVTFANPGDVAAAFALSRIGGGAIGAFSATATIANGVTVVRLANLGGVETEFGSLADGRYQLRVRANQVIGLDGNDDGAAGDDYALAGSVANGLYRLFGDGNGDGLVNAFDFEKFRRAFGTSLGQGAYFDWLDFDASGTINAFDYARMRSRFGSGVP